MMAAEEESLKGGFFEKIIEILRTVDAARLGASGVAGRFCLILIGVSYVSISALGTDLLPAMDEGGFILDYVMPPGSSLQETNRVINHVEQIIRSVPEVESTRGARDCSWVSRP